MKKKRKKTGKFPTLTAFLVVLLTDAVQLAGAVGTEFGVKLAPVAAVAVARPGTEMEALFAGTMGEVAGMDGVVVAVSVAAVAVACIETN